VALAQRGEVEWQGAVWASKKGQTGSPDQCNIHIESTVGREGKGWKREKKGGGSHVGIDEKLKTAISVKNEGDRKIIKGNRKGGRGTGYNANKHQ